MYVVLSSLYRERERGGGEGEQVIAKITFVISHLCYSEERRLFVGMLSRGMSEEDVQTMFTPYGRVEDVSILRNAEGFSKG